MRPALDFETFSAAGFCWNEETQRWQAPPGAKIKGLAAVGAPAYSEHPTTEVLTGSYDLLDGKGIRRLGPHLPPPEDLFAHVTRPGAELESHNAMFERLIWANVCVPRYGYPPLPPIVQRCSMATARVNSLPGKLDALGDVLRLETRKDKEGKRLLDKFSVPRNPTKADARRRIPPPDAHLLQAIQQHSTPAGNVASYESLALAGRTDIVDRYGRGQIEEAADFERLCLYCDRDVQTEQAASSTMPLMSPSELEIWQINQQMNWRGIGINREAVRDCRAVLDQVLERYGAECRELTGGEWIDGRLVGGIGTSQVQALVGWVQGRMHGPCFRSDGSGGFGFSQQYDPILEDDCPF